MMIIWQTVPLRWFNQTQPIKFQCVPSEGIIIYDDDDDDNGNNDDGEDYYDDDDDWDGFGAKFHQFPILQYSYNQQQRKARVSEVWSSIMYKYNASRAETRSQDPERKYPVSWNQSPHFINDEQFIYV